MKINKNFKALSFITVLIVTIMELSIVIAYKPVQIGWVFVPGGVIGFPLVFSLSDIIAEVYGYKLTRRIIWECIICSAIFTFAIMTIIRLPSPADWHFQSDYNIVFSNIFRVFMAVLFGVTISSFVNIYLMSKWKIWLKGKHFIIRCFFSNAIGEIIVTIIADIIGFGGTMPIKTFIHMILSVYILKVVYSFIVAIPATFIAKFLKKYENIDVYDYNINYNPFSLKI